MMKVEHTEMTFEDDDENQLTIKILTDTPEKMYEFNAGSFAITEKEFAQLLVELNEWTEDIE
jgi:fructose-1-phosphate kinase PfkB-like protein